MIFFYYLWFYFFFIFPEEEIKRLHQALDSEGSYSQVGFSYDDEKKSVEDSQSPKQSEGSHEEDEAFVPEPELELPENMTVVSIVSFMFRVLLLFAFLYQIFHFQPETQKLNAIIIKTALFISRQGGQMEVLIKAKQANNQQFSFLSIDGELHPYYKHVLEAIKSGKYNPEKQPEKEESGTHSILLYVNRLYIFLHLLNRVEDPIWENYYNMTDVFIETK